MQLACGDEEEEEKVYMLQPASQQVACATEVLT